MRRILKWSAVALAASAGIVYSVDYAAVAWKIHRNQKPFADVMVDHVFTSTNKWKQVEWSIGNSAVEHCVYALFPHFGDRPCWYVQNHTMNITDTD